MSGPGPPEERPFDAGGPTLADIGEAELLRRLTEVATAVAPVPQGLGPGDDAAVWELAAGPHALALSQDAMVEGIDFRREWTTPWRVGRKALAAALSDLAATGAQPLWCLATLCAPASMCAEDAIAMQAGLCSLAAATGCAVAGGDVSASPGTLMVDVSVAGALPLGRVLRRDRGRPGDLIVVTGCLGAAAAGLAVLRDGVTPAPAGRASLRGWIDAQTLPSPRLAEGRRLLEEGCACAADLSDGLLVDAGRLADASGCGVEIWLDRVPVATELAQAFPGDWQALALGGGEDFELIAAVPPERAEALAASWPSGLAPLHVVGRLRDGRGLRLLESKGGAELPLPAVRSRHFAVHG